MSTLRLVCTYKHTQIRQTLPLTSYILDVKKLCKWEPRLKKLRNWGAPCISFFHQNCMIYVGGHAPNTNQIYLVTLRPRQLTQASFLQKNQTLQNVFLISVPLRWHRASVACKNQSL